MSFYKGENSLYEMAEKILDYSGKYYIWGAGSNGVFYNIKM